MQNLDIIYDVTTAVTQDETNTNKEVIYQRTCLPSFVTFDGFFFCLWPRTLIFRRNGRKSPSNRPPWLPITYRIRLKIVTYKARSGLAPFYMTDLISIKTSANCSLQSSNGLLFKYFLRKSQYDSSPRLELTSRGNFYQESYLSQLTVLKVSLKPVILNQHTLSSQELTILLVF